MAVAIGIDLGTTNSVAAVATAEGVKLAAEDGRPIHPSVVGFPEWGGVMVGQQAKPRRAVDPINTVFSAKRLIGQDVTTALSGLFDLRGKTAYVPGGYGGIGEAIAWALALAGAKVAISGRDEAKALDAADALRAAGHEALGLPMDAHSVPQMQDSVEAVTRHFGSFDILVNCVGMQREEALLDVTEEGFDEVLQVNLKAAMFLAQAAARKQIEGGKGGAQVHLLSVRAQLGLRGRGYSAYCSSKGGLVMMIRQHASELAIHGITVNGIAPTVVKTEMARHWLENPDTRRQVLDRIPLGRVADPQDVAGAAVFFASRASSFVTGQVLYLDGGITASQ